MRPRRAMPPGIRGRGSGPLAKIHPHQVRVRAWVHEHNAGSLSASSAVAA